MSEPSTILSSVVVRTLDELCFHFAEPADMPATHDSAVAFARVGIHGFWDGELVIGIGPRLLNEFTLGLLGEEEITPEESRQALLEIANVVCGNVLPELESKTAVFALSAPAPCDSSSFDQASLQTIAEASFDEGSIVVRMFKAQAPT